MNRWPTARESSMDLPSKAGPAAAITGGAPAGTPSMGLVGSLGVTILGFYVLLVYSRTPELIGRFAGTSLKVTFITLALVLLISLLSGRLPLVLFTRQGFYMLAVTAWLMLSIPFSVWKGGSANVFVSQWLLSGCVFIAAGAMPGTIKDCRKMLVYMVLGLGLICIYCWAFGEKYDGRLALSVGGTLANPNLLAMQLELGLPLCMLLPLRHGFLSARGLAGVVIGLVSLVAVALTESRAGALSLGLMLVVLFLESSGVAKVAAALLALLVTVGLVIFGSMLSSTRYVAMLTDDGSEFSDLRLRSAAESTASRAQQLQQSIDLTLQHPVFGVGIGMFRVAAADDSETRNERASWKETHNSYTQVSSETGLPALFFYLLLLGTCLKSLHSLHRLTRSEPQLKLVAQVTLCLLLALVATMSNMMFTSAAYQVYFPLLTGLAVAVERTGRQEIRTFQEKVAGPQTREVPPPNEPRAQQRDRSGAHSGVKLLGHVDSGESRPGWRSFR